MVATIKTYTPVTTPSERLNKRLPLILAIPSVVAVVVREAVRGRLPDNAVRAVTVGTVIVLTLSLGLAHRYAVHRMSLREEEEASSDGEGAGEGARAAPAARTGADARLLRPQGRPKIGRALEAKRPSGKKR